MKESDFFNCSELQTERLFLRQLQDGDAFQIHQLRSDPAINAFVGRTASTGPEEALRYIRKINTMIADKECLYWAITLKGAPELIGTICYWNFDMGNETAEIGYELLTAYQGIGIMTEVLKAVIDFGFEKMKIRIITAFPSADNLGSVKILEQNGFVLDAAHYENSHQDIANMLTFSLKNPLLINKL